MALNLRIGELARRTACQVETVRYYEGKRLLPKPPRTAANYRLYGQSHVDRLMFIRHCQTLDMSLHEIRALLRFYDTPQANCRGANEIIDGHIATIAQRIEDLKTLQENLKQLRRMCTGTQSARKCGMLHELSEPVKVGLSKARKVNGRRD